MLDADIRLRLMQQLDVLSFSDRVARILGYKREDVLSSALSLHTLIHSEDLADLVALFSPAASSRTGEIRLRIHGADGRIRCMRFRYLREETHNALVELTLHLSAPTDQAPFETPAATDMLTLLDNLEQSACLKDRDHVIRQVNRTFRSLFPDSGRDFVGRTDYDLFPEDYADKAYAAERRIFSGEAATRFAVEVSERRGPRRSFENRSLPVHNERGQVEWVCSVVADVTARTRAEELLRVSKEVVKDAHRIAGLGTFVADVPAGAWTASDALYAMLGLASDCARTISIWSDLVHPDDLARVVSHCGDLMMHKKPKAECELRFIRQSDRQVRWAKVEIEAEFNAEGRVRTLSGVIHDITQRKHAEAKIGESSALLQLFIHNAPTGLAMFDREMRYISASRRWMEDRGLNEWEVMGRSGYEVHPNHPPLWADDHQLALSGQAGTFREDCFVDQHGVKRWVYRMVVPWWEGAAVGGIVVFSEDITAQKRSSEALRKSEESLREAQQIAGVGSYLFDVGADSWTSSEALDTILGIDSAYARTRDTWLDLVHPDERSRMAAYVTNDVIGRGVPFDTEYRIIRPANGAARWVHGRGKVDYDSTGKPAFLRGTIQDITDRRRAEDSLRESRRILQIFIEHAPAAIAMFDREMRYMAVSRRWMESYNLGDQIVIGRSHYEIFPEIPESWKEAHRRGLAGEGLRVEQELFERADGRKHWIRWELLPWYKSDESIGGIVLFTEDISALKESADRLQLAASVFTHTSESILITDAQGAILDVNDAFSRITGYTREDVLGKNPRVLNSGRQPREFYADLWAQLKEKGQWSGEIWNRGNSGQILPGMLTISAVPDETGRPKQYVGLFSDLSPIKEREHQLKQIAHFDTLTGLPNRALLADRLRQAMAQAHRVGRMLAIAYLDLDDFGAINERHGHIVGDQVMNDIVQRMTSVLHGADTLARVGGDEFAAVFLDLANLEEGLELAAKIRDVITEPVQLADTTLRLSASVGVSFYPQEDEVEPDQLLRQADQAMYFAKLSGKGRFHVFDPNLDRHMRGRHEDLQRIREALRAEEFELHFQPKVNMRTGTVLGAEALIRWRHPEHGLLLPEHFLPVVEGNALIIELGEWVILSALAQIETWRSQGLDLPVSVNVDALQLQEPHFVEKLTALLARHPEVHPSKLELEVLESSAFDDVSQVSEVIRACSKIGVTFALDDFGTGYSSLAYLRRLPVDVLKIDRSFVHDMLDDPEDLTILEGVLVLANAFRRQAIAEGVETVDHGLMLLRLGCQIGQGFQIARPMRGNELPAWAAQWRPDPQWANVAEVDPANWPILHAGVEHRAWALHVEEFVQGRRAAAPAMDSHLCRLGIWLDTEKSSARGNIPAVHKLDALHQHLHAHANDTVAPRKMDDAAWRPEAIAHLHRLKDDLVNSLQQYVQSR